MKLYSRYLIILFLFFSSVNVLADTTVIPEVSVQANQSAISKKDVGMQTTHFTRDEIITSPVTDLSQLFQQQQSIVRVVKGANNQPALSLRGFGDNAAANSLILVNGFPLTNVSLQSPDFNAIALSDIERIDIIQGSQGSLYGDQAVGGVVNIITSHPEKWMGNINLGLGNFNQQFYQALIGKHFANGFFVKTYAFSNRNNTDRDHQQQKYATIYLQTGFDYARGTLRIDYQNSQNNFQIPGGLTPEQFAYHPHHSDSKNFSEQHIAILQLLEKHELNDNWLLEARLSHQQIHNNGLMSFNYLSDESQNLFNPRLLGSIEKNKWTIGYFGQQAHYQFHNKFFHERVAATQNHLYAQVITPLTDTVRMTLGGRFAMQHNDVQQIIGDHVNSLNHLFVSEQGLTWQPHKNWQFYLRRDGNFRFAKANEQTFLPDDVTVLAPQTGVSYETGLVYQNEINKTQVNLYSLQLKNEIAFIPAESASHPVGAYQNFSPTRRNGVTLTEDYQLMNKLQLNGQFNYVDARFISGAFSGNEIPAVPAVSANAGFSWQFMENFRAKYSALYTGNRYASLDVENLGKKQSAYWLNTIAIQYLRKSVDVSFEVNNVFNRKYAAFTLFMPVEQSYRLYPGMGRNYLLTIKVNLDE